VRDLPHIRAVYLEIDAQFEAARAAASGSGDSQGVSSIEEKQRINDQAYFVLCWGQLEAAIDDKYRSVNGSSSKVFSKASMAGRRNKARRKAR
jgi:hypothetical protein